MKAVKKVILIGYMASGKTVVARELSGMLNRDFIDLDRYVAERESLSIPEIFALKGETYFRTIELKHLKKLLKSTKSFVLSVGGGSAVSNEAMDVINQNGLSIYLEASVDTLYERLIQSDFSERPVLENIDENLLKNYIAMHLAEREVYYKKAKKTVVVDAIQVKDIALKIKELIAYSK